MRRSSTNALKKVPDEEKQRQQELLRYKLYWLMRERQVEWDNVVNFDETALLPATDRGWALRVVKTTFAGDAKTCITGQSGPLGGSCAAAVHDGRKIYAGPPSRTLLSQPGRHALSVALSCNQETLMELLHQIDEAITGERAPWICVLDCARQHIAAPFLAEAKKELPWCRFCFVPANSTGWNQPLDIAYMRSYKAHLTSAASQMLARQLLLTTTDTGLSKEDVSRTILRTQILGLSAAAVADMDVAARAYQCWKHLKGVDVETTLAAADALHAKGSLFGDAGAAPDVDEDERPHDIFGGGDDEEELESEEVRGEEEPLEVTPEGVTVPAAALATPSSPSRRRFRQSLWTLHHQLHPSGASSWHCALPTAAGHPSSLGWAGLGEVLL